MFAPGAVSIGIAPTGWTNDDLPTLGAATPFEQCVSEMALAGFEGCGLGHLAPTDPDEVLHALELRGLRVSGTWFATHFTATAMHQRTLERFRATLRFLGRVGATHVVMAELGHAVHLQDVAVLPNTPGFTDDQWAALVDGLRVLGAEAAEAGMVLCYHPHVGTGIERRPEIDRLMSATDPETVTLLLDTGHLAYAGEDPLSVARDYADRIVHVHLKDVHRQVLDRCTVTDRSFLESILDGVFTVPGNGDIDFRPILQALANANFAGWLVVEAEQDPATAEPLLQAQQARAYLRAITGQ